jgi:hypothetical protein
MGIEHWEDYVTWSACASCNILNIMETAQLMRVEIAHEHNIIVPTGDMSVKANK